MADKQTYTSKDNGALWIAPGGPNSKVEYLPCHDLEDIAQSNGSITLIQCINERGEYETIGSTVSAPEPTTTTLGTYVGKVADWIETVKCPFPLYVMLRGCGKASVFENWERGMLLQVKNVANKTTSGLVRMSEDVPAMHTFDIEAYPNVIDFFRLTSLDITPTLTGDEEPTSLRFLDDTACWDGCGENLSGCETGYLVTSPDAAATAKVYAYPDWTATAADPFAADEQTTDVALFKVGRNTTRVLVIRGTTDAGNPMEIAYSDDAGTTWTNVNVGSTNGEFATKRGTIFVGGKYDIFLVSNLGRIYKSEDGGESWVVKENATITAAAYNGVHFTSPLVGYAVGTAGLVVKTVDGGKTWGQTGSAAGAANLFSVFALSDTNVWVGSTNGVMYNSKDGGTTWTAKTLPGGANDVNDIYFANPYVGYVANGQSIKFTITGGFTWELIDDTANIYTNNMVGITYCSDRLVYGITPSEVSQSSI